MTTYSSAVPASNPPQELRAANVWCPNDMDSVREYCVIAVGSRSAACEAAEGRVRNSYHAPLRQNAFCCIIADMYLAQNKASTTTTANPPATARAAPGGFSIVSLLKRCEQRRGIA